MVWVGMDSCGCLCMWLCVLLCLFLYVCPHVMQANLAVPQQRHATLVLIMLTPSWVVRCSFLGLVPTPRNSTTLRFRLDGEAFSNIIIRIVDMARRTSYRLVQDLPHSPQCNILQHPCLHPTTARWKKPWAMKLCTTRLEILLTSVSTSHQPRGAHQ